MINIKYQAINYIYNWKSFKLFKMKVIAIYTL